MGLTLAVAGRSGRFPRLGGRHTAPVHRSADEARLTLRKGEALGLVGEPGSGKTALGRALIGLGRVAKGSVRYRGRELTGLTGRGLRRLRPQLQAVFTGEDRLASEALDLRSALLQRLRSLGIADQANVTEARIAHTLEQCGLAPAERFLAHAPDSLSGAARLRAQFALALVSEPEVLLVGELPGNEDRADAARLLGDLRRDLDLTCIQVTTDLLAAAETCDKVAVVHLGRVVEIGPAGKIGQAPRHPYTRSLLQTAMGIVSGPGDRTGPGGPLAPRARRTRHQEAPLGCSYHPRCPVALAQCGWEARDLLALLERRWSGLVPEQAAEERRMFGRLEALSEGHLGKVVLTPGRGHAAAGVLEYLHGLRKEASAKEPREPLWKGVARLFEDSGQVMVEFSPSADPALTAAQPLSGEGEAAWGVACHLYGPGKPGHG